MFLDLPLREKSNTLFFLPRRENCVEYQYQPHVDIVARKRILIPPSLNRSIPKRALHEKGLQRQTSARTLFSSQERRALLVPLMNRILDGRQPLVVFLHRFTYDFGCSCFRRIIQNNCFRCFGIKRVGRLLGEPNHRRPVSLRPGLPRRGFRFDKKSKSNNRLSYSAPNMKA